MVDCIREADTEDDSVRGCSEHAGYDGISHGEGKHGVYHKYDEQEERHLESVNRTRDSKTYLLVMSGVSCLSKKAELCSQFCHVRASCNMF